MEQWWIFAIFGVVAIGFAILGAIRAKRRREMMAAWAASRGWTWLRQDNSFTSRFRGTPFGTGSSRKARNVVQGSVNGRALVAFDYSYETHSSNSNGGSSTQTHTFGVVAISLPQAVPTLELGRENAFSSLARGLGFHDIEFENADFNKQFKVKCDDRKFAYDVLNPRLMEWLMQTGGPAWRMERADILCWHSGTIDPDVIDADLRYLDAVVAGVPEFVWSKASGSA